MTHEQHYCKYCGKPYYYQVSGAGCFDELNNSQFCPECMEIMLEALKKSGRKQERYYRRLKEITITDEQAQAFRILDKTFEEHNKNNDFFSGTISVMPIYDYMHIVGYNYNRQKFYKCWNEPDESDVIYLTYYLYDSEEETYLDVYNDIHCSSNNYRFACSGQKTIKAEDVKPVPMKPLTGMLFYMDYVTPGFRTTTDNETFDFKKYLKDRDNQVNVKWIDKFKGNNGKLD